MALVRVALTDLIEKEHKMYKEEESFNLRFSLEAKFPDGYEGEDDERVWLNQWEKEVKPDIVKSIFQTLERFPGWAARWGRSGWKQRTTHRGCSRTGRPSRW